MKAIPKDVVIIGAGISGLACAYRLKALGADALLIESARRAGGVMLSQSVDGYLIERGPNSSQGTEELLALVDEMGVMDELVEGDPKAPAYVYFNRQLHVVPAGPGQFIKSNLLTARGKLRIMMEPFIPRRRSDEEETVASFVRRRIGREAAERMVAPFVSGIYAGDSEALSVQAAFPRLADLEANYGGLFRGAFRKAREARRAKKAASSVLDKAAPTRKRLVSFRRGMGYLPEALAARIGEDLITGVSDCLLGDEGPGRFTVSYNRGGTAEEITCRQLVLATPSRAAAGLVRSISDDISRLLEEIEYPPLAIAYLSYDESSFKFPLEGFGFLVAPGEGLKILGAVWNTSLFEGRAPEGKALLTIFIGGARAPELVRLPDAELVAMAHGELQKVLGVSTEPHLVAITRWERAIPQYNLGHRDRVRHIESLLADRPGLSLIGNYLHGVSTGDCIKEADRVAREIHAKLAGKMR